jgi:hypothetical protein
MPARGTGPLILKSSDVHDVDMNLILSSMHEIVHGGVDLLSTKALAR